MQRTFTLAEQSAFGSQYSWRLKDSEIRFHGAGDFDVERGAFVKRELDLHTFLQIEGIIAEHIGPNGRLLECFVIHEMVVITVCVQIRDIVEIQAHILNRLARVERPFNVRAALQVAGFYTNVGVTAAGLVVAVIQHFVKIAIQFEGDPFS